MPRQALPERATSLSPGSIFLASTIAASSVLLIYLRSASLGDLPWPSARSFPIMAGPSSRTPAYFLGIGGPNFMENREHPAFKKLGETGREITTKVRPRAVVVISAHWP